MVFRLTLDRFTCCVHVTITDVNNLFPDFRSMLWDLILTLYTINSLAVCCSTNKLLKTWLGKAKFFCIPFNLKTKQKPATKIQYHVFYYIEDHMKNSSPFAKFFFSPKSSLSMVLHSPLQLHSEQDTNLWQPSWMLDRGNLE